MEQHPSWIKLIDRTREAEERKRGEQQPRGRTHLSSAAAKETLLPKEREKKRSLLIQLFRTFSKSPLQAFEGSSFQRVVQKERESVDTTTSIK